MPSTETSDLYYNVTTGDEDSPESEYYGFTPKPNVTISVPRLRTSKHYESPAAFNEVMRPHLKALFNRSRGVKDLLSQGNFGTGIVFVKIIGESRDANGGAEHPYYHIIGSDIQSNERSLRRGINNAFNRLNLLQKSNEPGYIKTGRRVIVQRMIVEYYQQQHGGNGRRKLADKPKEIGGYYVMDPPPRIGFADRTEYRESACFSRATYWQFPTKELKKQYAQRCPADKLRKKYGVPSKAPVSMYTAFEHLDSEGIEAVIYTWDGTTLTEVRSPNHATTVYKFRGFKYLLDIKESHYYIMMEGVIPAVDGEVDAVNFVCDKCGETVSVLESDKHLLMHDITSNEFKDLQVETGRFKIEEGETIPEAQKRYCDEILDVIERYMKCDDASLALWLKGYGGCGKSYVINKFKESHDVTTISMSHTGVAAQNIGGETIERFMKRFKPLRENLPEVIIIDEISMMSSGQLTKLNNLLNKAHGRLDGFMGGCKVIYLGDFGQLPCVKNKDTPPEFGKPITYNSIFRDNTYCVPMTYGWRYINHPEYFEFLKKLQFSKVTLKEWTDIGFKTITNKDLIEKFSPSERPAVISTYKDTLNDLNARIQEYDIKNVDSYETISIQCFKVMESNRKCDTSDPFLLKVSKYLGNSKFYLQPSKVPGGDFNDPLTLPTCGKNGEYNCVESPCDINTTLTKFYPGQRLLATLNRCAFPYTAAGIEGSTPSTLMNSQEITFDCFVGERMIVSDKDGNQHAIDPIWRAYNIKSGTWIAKGYPIQSGAAFSAHKSQGKTFQSIAVILPQKKNVMTWNHIYYVILSRCVSARNVYFIVDNTENSTKSLKQQLTDVYRILYGENGGPRHITSSDFMKDLMMFGNADGGYLKDHFKDSGLIDTEDHEAPSFPSTSGLKRWEPSVPKQFGRNDTSEFKTSYMLEDTILFDFETAAKIAYHPDFYDEGGKFISVSNTDRLTMEEYQVCLRHYKDGKVLWCKDTKHLKRFERYQHSDGYIIFQKGEYEDDNSETEYKWVARMTYDYIMAHAAYHRQEYSKNINKPFGKYKRRNYRPVYLIGFNIDGFDTRSILQRFTDTKLDVFYPHIIPNNGSTITQLRIMSKVGGKPVAHVVTHDLYTLMGRGPMTLKRAHESLITNAYKGRDEDLRNILRKYVTEENEVEHMMEWKDSGKDIFPYFLMVREGHKAALVNEVREYDINDFSRRDHAELIKNPERRRLNIFEHSRLYNKKDIMVNLLCYLSKEEVTINTLNISCLMNNTAQQMTVQNFLQHGNSPVILGEDSKSNPTKTKYKMDAFLLRPHENLLNKECTVGGKTLPRYVWYEKGLCEADYSQVDMSGMYAHAMTKFAYPYGKHVYCVKEETTQRILRLWKEVKATGDPMKLADPRGSSFPFMFECRVTLKKNPLVMDPGIGYKKDGEILWTICDEGDATGIVKKSLTNVDLAHEMAEGSELLEVHCVLFWEKIGEIFSNYVDHLNDLKCNALDEVVKNQNKLDANSFYGATLKKDHNDIFVILDPRRPDLFTKTQNIDWSNIHHRVVYKNGCLGIQAKAKVDDNKPAGRPNFWGAFVLSWSKWCLGEFIRKGFGETFIPSTKAQAKEALLHGPLYGDTDSVFISYKHIERINAIEKDMSWEDKQLADVVPPGYNKKTKTGKFLDELSNDKDCDVDTNWQAFVCTKILRFASNAPKSYCTEYELASGKRGKKNRLKGIATGLARISLDDKDLMDEEVKHGKRVYAEILEEDDTQAIKRQRIEEYKEDMEEKRDDLLLSSDVYYDKDSDDAFEIMYQAIKDPTKVIRTLAQLRMKNFGPLPQHHEMDRHIDGSIDRRNPYDLTTVVVKRSVCGEILTRRRFLRPEEVSFLGISDMDYERILVPYGWNYDGSLFNLN